MKINFSVAAVVGCWALIAVICIFPSDSFAKGLIQSQKSWASEAGWDISWNGSFEGCFAQQKQTSKTDVFLGFVRKDKRLVLGLSNTGWNFVEPGRKYTFKLIFDNQRVWTSTFNSTDIWGRKVLIGAYNGKSISSEFARSSVLRLSLDDKKIVDISLKGTSTALKIAAECHQKLFVEKSADPKIAEDDFSDIEKAYLLQEEAMKQHNLKENALAEMLYVESLKLLEKSKGPESLDVGLALNNLAILHFDSEANSKAEPLFRRSLAILETFPEMQHPYVAQILTNLANLLTEKGDLATAEIYNRRSLEILEKVLPPDHNDIALSLNSLGALLAEKGDYHSAIPIFRRSLAIRIKNRGARHLLVGRTLSNLGIALRAIGDYSEAERVLPQALAIIEENLGPEHRQLSAIFNNFGTLLHTKGDFVRAEHLYRRALAINEKTLGSEHREIAQTLNNLANLIVDDGRYEDAEPIYRRALAMYEKLFGKKHRDVAQTLNGLANLLIKKGEYDEAEKYQLRSLAIREDVLGPEHPEVAQNFDSLANLFQIRGDFSEAENYYRRAIAIREKVFGAEHPNVAISLNNLAVLFAQAGDEFSAEANFRRAIAIREKSQGPDHPDIAQSLNNLADVYQISGRYDQAYNSARRAAAIYEARLNLSHGQQNRKVEISGNALSSFENVMNIAWEIGDREPDRLNKVTQEVFDTMQIATRTITAAALNQMSVRFSAGNSAINQIVRQRQDLLLRWQLLDQALISAIGQTADNTAGGRATEIRAGLADIGRELAVLDKSLSQNFPEYSELSNPKSLKIKDVQALLSGDEALLMYSVQRSQSYVLAITREGVKWKKSALGAKAIEEKILELRAGLDVNNLTDDNIFNLDTSYSLYRELVEPIQDLIDNKTHLLIVPAGALTSLPFHLLVMKPPPIAVPIDFAPYQEAAWLVRRYATTTLPSASSLRALRLITRKTLAGNPFIGFGDPDFSRRSLENRTEEKQPKITRAYSSYFRGAVADLDILSKSLPRLEDTAEELLAVANSLGAEKNNVILRENATEDAVKQISLEDYRVVHFATHALVAGQTQMVGGEAEPALALTLPKNATAQNDGLLLASEVAQLKLNADWVVLSACNTAAGDKPGAEALSGLARAFFYAGTRAMLVTHWEVNSAAAVRLITKTFEILKHSPAMGKSEALRRSMLDLLVDSSNPINSYPAIWAPFVVIGEGGVSAN